MPYTINTNNGATATTGNIRQNPLQLGTYHMVMNSGFEPQRNNNFELQITGLSGINSNAGDYITLSVADYAPPQINISSINVSYGNNSVKFAGKPEFPNSTITLNDFIGINIERVLFGWQKLVYDPDTQIVGRAVDYKKTAYLLEYDPSGQTPRQWQINGCWPAELQLGQFSQEGNSLRQITCTLIYDNAVPI